MPTSKKPRKKYRPKPVLADPVSFALESFMPVRQYTEYMLTLRVKNHGAMTALTTGKATVDDINALMAMSNASIALLHLGFGSEYEGVASLGYTSLKAVVERGIPTNRFVCRAQEINALNAFMELHDAQMDVITIEDLQKAIDLANGKKLPRLFLHSLKESP
jgi:hypothetical protein